VPDACQPHHWKVGRSSSRWGRAEQAGQTPGQKGRGKSRGRAGGRKRGAEQPGGGAPKRSVCAFSAFSAAVAATAAAACSRCASLGLRPTKPKRVPSSLASEPAEERLPPSPG
jgi:hypothetical protein